MPATTERDTAAEQDALTWGDFVKGLREHIGFTQTEMGDATGYRQATICGWELGRITRPHRSSIRIMRTLAEHHGFEATFSL